MKNKIDDSKYEYFLTELLGGQSSDIYTCFEVCSRYDISGLDIFEVMRDYPVTHNDTLDITYIAFDIALHKVYEQLRDFYCEYNLDDAKNDIWDMLPTIHANYMCSSWDSTDKFLTFFEFHQDVFNENPDSYQYIIQMYNECR